MNCLDFHTVKAVTDATASFRHFKPALCKIVYPTCDHSLARAPTLKPQGAEKAVYCEGMNYAIV